MQTSDNRNTQNFAVEVFALAKAYSFFLDQPTVDLSDRIGKSYVGREIEEGVFSGANSEAIRPLIPK